MAADADALTTAELIERLTKAVYSEVDTVKEGDFTNRKPAISSLRRNLQRAYLQRLSRLALGQTGRARRLPDGRLRRARQAQVADRLDAHRPGQARRYTQDHLQETSARIAKVVDAKMLVSP